MIFFSFFFNEYQLYFVVKYFILEKTESVNNYSLHTDRDTAAFQSRSSFWKKKIGLLIFEKSFRNLLDSFVKQVFKHYLRLQTLNTIECDDY